MNIFLGKPSSSVEWYIRRRKAVSIVKNIASADDVVDIISEKLESVPSDVQERIREIQEHAVEDNPDLQAGCEELNVIAIVELARYYGIDIVAALGKDYPRTEDDDAILASLTATY